MLSGGSPKSCERNDSEEENSYGGTVAPVPSPDSQCVEKAYTKRHLDVFSYLQVGPKKLRKCNACGTIKEDLSSPIQVEVTSTSPNLETNGIAALDYMISECLSQRKDEPFKPLNANIKGTLKCGTNKISILDIIELQIEKIFKVGLKAN